MKSRQQKQEELKKASALLGKSKSLLFLDFSGIGTAQLRELRRVVQGLGGALVIVKKRLLNVLFKEKHIEYDARQFKGSVGTVFAEGSHEDASGPVYKFFVGLPETEAVKKADYAKKILGGYDVHNKQIIDAATVVAIGQLPSREVLLSQVLGAITAPIRALMYLLSQKVAQSGGGVPSVAVEESKLGQNENAHATEDETKTVET